MNILFLTPKDVHPTAGGIERITYTLARLLRQRYGYGFGLVYLDEVADDTKSTDVFDYKCHLPYETFADGIAGVLNQHQVDVVIVQGSDVRLSRLMAPIRAVAPSDTRLLFVFHSMPGFELVRINRGTLLYRLLHGQALKANIVQLAMQTASRLAPPLVKRYLRSKYMLPCKSADRMVMLAQRAIHNYCTLANVPTDRFVAIPNMLTLDEAECVPCKKSKTALIVARLDDWSKRISLALRLWKRAALEGWTLRIVGYGEDERYLRRLVERKHIDNVVFEGRQNPISYYREAAIFLMTSASEGWSLTLTEAQQNGCVPVAFDCFPSASEIITDGRNGLLVAEGDWDGYVKALRRLAENDEKCSAMSEAARRDCQRYSPDAVSAQWNDLFNEITVSK